MRNHYYKRISNIDAIRKKERIKLFYLKKKNIILEDKCAFYSDHVEEINKILSEQIKMKTDEAQSLHKIVTEMNEKSNEPGEAKNIDILKLREEQLERLSRQLNTINSLYHKQVENNKKLMQEIEEINRNMHYQNNKIEEQKNNAINMKKKMKFYKKYNRNKRTLKINYDNINFEKLENPQNKDICLSVLCILKTELEIIDDENKNNNNNSKRIDTKIYSSFKKLTKKKNSKRKDIKPFDDICKRGFLSFYKKKLSQKKGIEKLEYRRTFTFPLQYEKRIGINVIRRRKNNKENSKNEEELKTPANDVNVVKKKGMWRWISEDRGSCDFKDNKKNTSNKTTSITRNSVENAIINDNKTYGIFKKSDKGANNIFCRNDRKDTVTDKNKHNKKNSVEKTSMEECFKIEKDIQES